MKKKILCGIFATIFASSAFAQKYRDAGGQVNYLSIPSVIQESTINTYSLEYVGNVDQLTNMGYSINNLTNTLNLQAIKYADGDAENIIKLYFEGYGNLKGVENSVQVTEEGKVNTKYFVTYSYRIPMRYEILSNFTKIAGEDLGTGGFMATYTYNTKHYVTPYDAMTYFNSGAGKAELLNHIKTNFDSRINSFFTKVRSSIDYAPAKEHVEWVMFKTTKKEDFTDYETAAESAKTAVSTLIAGNPRTDLLTQLESSITFWKTKLTQLDPTNDDQDKLYYAAAFNLAQAYYWADDFDNALLYAKDAEKAKEKEGRLNNLKRDIELRKVQLTKLKAKNIDPYTGPVAPTGDEIRLIVTKKQAERDAKEIERLAVVSNAEAKAKADAARYEAERKEALKPKIDTVSGYIINRNHEKLEGVFRLYRANNGPKTDKAFFVANGTVKEIAPTIANVLAYEYEGRKYESVVFYYELGVVKNTDLLEVLYESPKIKVFKALNTKGGTYTEEIHFKRPSEELTVNTSSMVFTSNYKKKLADYFADCPKLSNKILEGQYKNTVPMRIAAATDYTNCK